MTTIYYLLINFTDKKFDFEMCFYSRFAVLVSRAPQFVCSFVIISISQ